jgi:hypothetical protein
MISYERRPALGAPPAARRPHAPEIRPTARSDTVSPSFRRSSSETRASPQVGFARAIETISCCRLAGIGGRPGRDFHRQNSRQP